MNELLAGEEQRFYLEPGDIVKRQPALKTGGAAYHSKDLYSLYDQASTDLRQVLLGAQQSRIREVTASWMEAIKQERYQAETVKEWVLKLLLDLKLKTHALHLISPAYSADTLHKEIVNIDSLAGLHDWLNDHLESTCASAGGMSHTGSRRAEITNACIYVSRRLHARITLDEVAEHLHMNTSYFCRLFKKETGTTFIEYVTRLKMMRAKELLDQTGATVGEICEQLGYDNQSYFIKTFKLYSGMTPVEYRGKAR